MTVSSAVRRERERGGDEGRERGREGVAIEVQRCELEIEWSTVNTNHVTLNSRLLLPCHHIVYRL